MEFANLHHSLVASHGGHRTEVLVSERFERSIISPLCYLLDVLSQKGCLLDGYLCQLWMTARVGWVGGLQALVANGKETVHVWYAIEVIYLDAESTPQLVAVNALDRLLHRNGPFLDVFVSVEIGGGTSGEYEIIVFYLADGSLQYLLIGKKRLWLLPCGRRSSCACEKSDGKGRR